ncbi:hypothetical protein WMY93_006882 [Mugilogobius chulae]|uniref:C-type lectin domain-containing protein n=1 Tax=Mugilogobius chulae TaxID=88201 RepID=A0AAW0PLI4_9GOBI
MPDKRAEHVGSLLHYSQWRREGPPVHYGHYRLTDVIRRYNSAWFLPSCRIKSFTSPLPDPLQFAYRANRSVDDAINLALHFILQHLDSPGTYARILFVDFSSAFNTILPALLQDKLSQLNEGGRPAGVLVQQQQPGAQRSEDSGDDRGLQESHSPLTPLALTDSPITTVDSIRFLGTTITQDLKWEPSISSLIKKAQQRMYFLRQLKKAKLPAQMMVSFTRPSLSPSLPPPSPCGTLEPQSGTDTDCSALCALLRRASSGNTTCPGAQETTQYDAENNQVKELLAQVHKQEVKVAELKWTNSPEANLSRALWASDTYCYDKDVNGDLKCHNCPKQWSHYNGMCYKPEIDLKTFDEALHVCSISQKEQGVEGYWVGLRHDGEVWRWFNGSQLVYHEILFQLIPLADNLCAISKSEQCTHGYTAVNCSSRQNYICQNKGLVLT